MLFNRSIYLKRGGGLVALLLLCSVATSTPIYQYHSQDATVFSDTPPPVSTNTTVITELPSLSIMSSVTIEQDSSVTIENDTDNSLDSSLANDIARAKQTLVNAKALQQGDMQPSTSGVMVYTQAYRQRVLKAEQALEKLQQRLPNPE